MVKSYLGLTRERKLWRPMIVHIPQGFSSTGLSKVAESGNQPCIELMFSKYYIIFFPQELLLGGTHSSVGASLHPTKTLQVKGHQSSLLATYFIHITHLIHHYHFNTNPLPKIKSMRLTKKAYKLLSLSL